LTVLHVEVVPEKPELVSAVEAELAGPELVSAVIGNWFWSPRSATLWRFGDLNWGFFVRENRFESVQCHIGLPRSHLDGVELVSPPDDFIETVVR
jgi:hypothetical protein